MIAFCPRCGAEFPEQVRGAGLVVHAERCADCGLTVADPPPMLAPGPEEDEVEYELAEWPVTGRSEAVSGLVDAEIAYRWEADLVLVVPAVAEEEVDRLFDELEEGGEPGVVAAAADDDADGGEEAQAAMADLFVAADRLQHAPNDEGIGDDLVAAATLVRASAAPYGIERPVWRRIQDLAGSLVGDMEEAAEEDVVAEDARSLRDFLRDLV
ncbi:MAG: hypothetical protein M3066_20660 [Actinomycetota bacterium]|nr:hypothetical protein [Actinomycetota bacterium]